MERRVAALLFLLSPAVSCFAFAVNNSFHVNGIFSSGVEDDNIYLQDTAKVSPDIWTPGLNYALDSLKAAKLVRKAVKHRRKGKCRGDKIMEETRRVSCKLRRSVVSVPGETRHFVYPEFVEISRCEGHCHGTVICNPAEYENVTIQVIVYDILRSTPPMCTEVNVEQHKACRCSCQITKEHCFRNQYYDPPSCRCKCYTEIEKYQCIGSPLHRWDQALCTCECRDFYRCPYMNYYYDVTRCRCRSFFDWV